MIKPMQFLNREVHFLRKTPSNMLSLLLLYRYITLVLTSIVFLLGPRSPMIFKIGVIVSLAVAAGITTDLIRRHIKSGIILKTIVLAETLGLTLLLIPTGGISSPFIWYVLNPVLVAAGYLTPLFCWGALAFFLGSASIIGFGVFRSVILEINWDGSSYFYLVCFLITLLTRLFSGLTRELDSKADLLRQQQKELIQVNNVITDTNQKYQDTLEYVMSLYHILENFSYKKSPEKFIKEIAASILKSIQSKSAFFWLTTRNHQNSHIENSTDNQNIEADLLKAWSGIRGKEGSFTYNIKGKIFWMKIIRSSYYVGVLGIEVSNSNEFNKIVLLNRPFEFLAELSEIMLERIHIECIVDQMIIIEEQNRIANEIHDSVSQRLFGIVHALHSLQFKSKQMTNEELNKEFGFLSESANTTLKELRAAIYRLSTAKKGEKSFLVRLKKYLDEFSKLNDIRVNYQISGDEALMSEDLKQGLYRIICEACGNAVKHGECNEIGLSLTILEEKIVIGIHDDGLGFKADEYIHKSEKGIGLVNMRNIVYSFFGKFSIIGSKGLGTEIQIEIPSEMSIYKQEVIG